MHNYICAFNTAGRIKYSRTVTRMNHCAPMPGRLIRMLQLRRLLANQVQ